MTHLLSFILSIGLTVFFYCIVQQALEAVFASSWSYQKRLLLRSRYTPFQRLRLYPVREHHHPDYGELVVLLTGLLRIRVGAFLALPMLTYLSVRDPQLEVAVTCCVGVTVLALDLPMWLFVVCMTRPVPGGREWKFSHSAK